VTDHARHQHEAGDASAERTDGARRGGLEHERAADEMAATSRPPVAIGPFTAEACSALAHSLGDLVLGRALTVFEQLEVDGTVEADRLAETLAMPAAGLWGAVTNPVKLQAESLGLPLPYEVVPSHGGGEVWVDSLNTAPLMVGALRAEMRERLRPLRPTVGPDRPGGSAPASTDARPYTRYERLTARLKSLEKGERRLGLEQIEGILGFELPPKAWGDPRWWSNDSGLPYFRHAEAWLRAGWQAFPDLEAQAVVFRPVPSDRQESSTQSRGRLGRLAHRLRRSSSHRTTGGSPYSRSASEEFAAGLSDTTLMRAECLFRALDKRGDIESGELARLLNSEASRLGGQLATPLRRRAHLLALDPPYEIAVSAETGARVWRAAEGALEHLPRALTKELRSR
jgi:hypothetical protein